MRLRTDEAVLLPSLPITLPTTSSGNSFPSPWFPRENARPASADLFNRFDHRVVKILILKVRPHPVHDTLPELVAAFLVNRLIANDSKLMRAGATKMSTALRSRVLCMPADEIFFCAAIEGIDLQFAALDKNTNLAGSFRFRVANRFDDPVVLKFAEKFFRSHPSHQLDPRAAAAETSATTAKSAETAATAAGRPPPAATPSA